jgi:hypothetical protein
MLHCEPLMGGLLMAGRMKRMRITVRLLAGAAWIAAVAGIWLLPVRAVVVVTGAAVTGTTVSVVLADKSGTVDRLVDALANTQPRSLSALA